MPNLTPATLRAWRQSRGMSRRAAAEELGIPEATLYTLERGRSPSSALFGPIAKIIELLGPRRATEEAEIEAEAD